MRARIISSLEKRFSSLLPVYRQRYDSYYLLHLRARLTAAIKEKVAQ